MYSTEMYSTENCVYNPTKKKNTDDNNYMYININK